MTVHEFADLLENLIKENGYDNVKNTVLSLLEFYKEKCLGEIEDD